MAIALQAKSGFTFGCDPELFIFDDKDRPVSAEGLIPGTKAEPYAVPNGAVQVDGMAAEFNIDPVDNFDDFNNNIVSVMGSLRKMLPKGYSLKAVPHVVFSQDVWDASPDKAKELGCSPDFNAWTGEVNHPPEYKAEPTLRTAAGHIHIGWDQDLDVSDPGHVSNCLDFVKQLDWYLGGWSLQKDPEPVRRLLYGKAGACRIKDYGVEYRVLSNFWLVDKTTRMQVWNRLQRAIYDMRDTYMPQIGQTFNANLIKAISESTRDTGIEYYYKYPILTINN